MNTFVSMATKQCIFNQWDNLTSCVAYSCMRANKMCSCGDGDGEG